MSSLVTTANDLVLNQEIKERLVATPSAWTAYEKILFRIAVIFFICICIPNSVAWFEHVIAIDWTSLHYRDLYDIARFGSGINIFGNTIFGSNLLGYANWVTTLLISIAVGLAWSWIVRARGTERSEYQVLYYWLRAVVRYRAGIGIIGFGFTKLLPVQMPYPSLGLLNTDFGDFTAQKIYWLSIGIVPWYQIFAGIVEVLAGSLLLFRKTTAIGAVLLFGALGDIVYVNFAYDGGVHVYSSYFVLLSAFLLVPEIPRLYNLLIRERVTQPFGFYPVLPQWLKITRVGLKSGVLLLFLVVFFYLQLVNFLYDPYKQPSVAGVLQLRGNYAVAEFRLNNNVLPANAQDTLRWQEVTFENWSTLTFRVNRPTPLDLSNGGGDPQRDVNRTFEVSGVAGGQRVFHYEADEKEQTLYLEDKYKPIPDRRNRTAGVGGDGGSDKNLQSPAVRNKPAVRTNAVLWKPEEWISPAARERIGNEVDKIDAKAQTTRRRREFAQARSLENRNRMILQYSTADNGNIVVLTGLNENKDSIKVVLNRVNRNYALSASTLNAGKY
ncbi:hypothetical protein [Flavihumibacter solisilvae]|uniref:DoxX family protein n=1 Tax=Flavihumibacter solisilvae TaxID=1349421 RepID=A0A0C1I9Q0_9BACT|nr:hypothetical protein [Flavihumibacter solisilvae]KIC90740.1 hypothetical protein OI18_22875 [Flavihumibacter solisilvae]